MVWRNSKTRELGYVNDKRGRWIWGNKLVRKELEDVEALRKEVEWLRETCRRLQNDLRQDHRLGLSLPTPVLGENEWLIKWKDKHEMVCPECGKQLFFTKEDGRYVGYCCGKWYRTRIEALRVIQDG